MSGVIVHTSETHIIKMSKISGFSEYELPRRMCDAAIIRSVGKIKWKAICFIIQYRGIFDIFYAVISTKNSPSKCWRCGTPNKYKKHNITICVCNWVREQLKE